MKKKKMNSNQNSPIFSLPKVIVKYMIQYFDFRSLINFYKTCKKFHQILHLHIVYPLKLLKPTHISYFPDFKNFHTQKFSTIRGWKKKLKKNRILTKNNLNR